MSQLTTAQVNAVANFWANAVFVSPNVTAHCGSAGIQSAVSAVDAAFDTTINSAQASGFGPDTIAQGLSAQITASIPQATVVQQTLLVCYVLMKRAGII